MSADPILSEMYGTNQPEASPEDAFIQKVSAALSEGGIDFDSLTQEEKAEVLEAAQTEEQVQGGEAEATKEAEAAKTAEAEAVKEGEAKLAEADTMGRVMAHSFNQELGLIQKEAAQGGLFGKPSKKERLLAALRKGKATAGAGAKAVAAKAKAVAAKPGARKGALGAALVGGGYAAGRMKKGAAEGVQEAIDAAGEEKAAEILEDLGVEPEQLEAAQAEQTQEQVQVQEQEQVQE